MKYAILLAVLFSSSAFSAPVLNRSAPAGEGIMVYVDHIDPNLYYVSPQTIGVQKSEEGRPIFSYIEYRNGGRLSSKQAVMQMLLMPEFNTAKINAAQERIRAINPSANFATLPFVRSSIAFTPEMQKLVVSGSCAHGAGDVGQSVACTISLTDRGRMVMGKLLKSGKELTVHFSYHVEGMLQGADGSYSSAQNPVSIAGTIGGPEFVSYPDLFRITSPSAWPTLSK